MSVPDETETQLLPAREWLAGRGWTPFDFQIATWSAYLRGRSGIVSAPTGTGKTNAVWLGPVLEYLAERAASAAAAPDAEPVAGAKGARRKLAVDEPLRVIWLTPLRSLAADTARSLAEVVESMGLPWSVELRTGDTKGSVKARQRKLFPTALVTTPESLSLLLSYPDTREKLASLRAVVVDEWHELLGTKRGVQTELALARLRRWSPGLRTWGLSATLGNMHQARDVLLGSGSADGVIVSSSADKEIVVETLMPVGGIERFPWAGHLGLRGVPGVVEAMRGARTTLLFTNTRNQAENWYQALTLYEPEWEHVIGLHHGSIDKAERDRVEQALAAGKLKAVVCTSSLDLGIDFAPVEQVIQVGSPKGVSRLLQRAG